ncbi:hypothetical protein AOLI_G00005880 [Acnodon oligacanthus]
MQSRFGNSCDGTGPKQYQSCRSIGTTSVVERRDLLLGQQLSVAPGVASDGGRDLCISLDNYRLPQVGQSPASKVLSHQGLPSSSVTLISSYALHLTFTKDEFYTNLNDVIKNIHSSEHLVFLGDLNARVGGDPDSWPSCLGSFEVGKINENGQRLLELSSYHSLCVTNSYFQVKPQHRVSGRHPGSKHWHQLDMVIIRHTILKHVLLIRSYHRVDCNSDHSLVCCKIRLQPKKLHHSKQEGKPRTDRNQDATSM